LSQPLQGKIAIVTGSSRGIGKVLALRLAHDGADIVVCARSEQQGELPGTIGETATAVQHLGRRALALKLDLSRDDEIDAIVDRTLREFGRIDILVNNAVIVGPRRTFIGGDADFLDLAYRVNVRGPYRLAQCAASVMVAQGGGTIVNITSGAARHPRDPLGLGVDAMDPSYGITKASLDRITTAYASELKAHNIAIISVAPGLVITERIRHAAIRRNVDFGRAEAPDVIATAVSTICQDPMHFTGQILSARDVVNALSQAVTE
jgi:NAD(P)-dependent dehydrogenase (short-subunit alcohol dehydrogenase family)